MLIKKPADIPPSEITPKQLYLGRREFLASAGATIAALAGGGLDGALAAEKLPVTKRMVTTTDPATPYQAVTTYNNFYEFGSDKSDPARNAGAFKPKPWSVAVEGACGKPGVYSLEDVLKGHPLEERVYRHRCVEGWSMVIPWVGFPLADFIRKCQPTAKARYVAFESYYDARKMPMSLRLPFDWPFTEGLRMDEATHPLAILAVGLYREPLPHQDGAPIRLVVPWKYGFKSIKSIVRIGFVEDQPLGTYEKVDPDSYGFYANVNPTVDHPRWSQATERRIGEFFKRKTLIFNGYGREVGKLYAGMDLKKNW